MGRARGCLQSAIQGRVSQNLRLIQVIFGHTASEEQRGVSGCARAGVRVCVQTRSRQKVTENPTAERVLSFTPDQIEKELAVLGSSITVWCCIV